MKIIIFEYRKAFSRSQIKIAITKGADSYIMVIQDEYGFGDKPSDAMTEYMWISEKHCHPIFSKTIEIEELFFQSAYETISNSLVPIFSAESKTGFDGDGLTIKISCDEGHDCEIYLWAPSYNKDDYYKINNVYQLFLQVLEKAGLRDWYGK